MIFNDNSRVSLFFSNKLLPDIQKNNLTSLQDQNTPETFSLERKLTNREFYKLYKDIYKHWHGRIANYERALLWYPGNLRKIFNVTKHLFQDDGPLPLPWRYYIAILVLQLYTIKILMWCIECRLL
mgnify:CR=1 FL=1